MTPADLELERWLRFNDTVRGPEIPRGYTYGSFEDYVLDRGTHDLSRALSREQASFVRGIARGIDPKMRQCFFNAQVLALHPSERFSYREGFAVCSSGWPVLHGWNLLDGTHLIDLTWRTRVSILGPTRQSRRVRGTFPEAWAYRGVSYSHAEIRDRLKRHAAWCSFLDDMGDGYPCLRLPRLASRKQDTTLTKMIAMHTSTVVFHDDAEMSA